MKDYHKSCLSCSLLLASAVLPFAALGIGWAITQDWQTSGYIMLATFGVLILAAFILMMTIANPSPLLASLPFALGLVYTLIPNPIPIPVDAVAASLIGAVFSYVLWLKRWPAMPRWLAWPMLLCCAFNIIGGVIPGPLDEIIAYFLILGNTGYRLLREFAPAPQVVDLSFSPEATQQPSLTALPPAAAESSEPENDVIDAEGNP